MRFEFNDIAITGLAVERTRQSDRAPGLRHMFLALSSTPSAEWEQIFEAERRFPRHTMWREAWCEGAAIVVDCVPEEIERYHLNDLREDVANTNAKYREYLAKVAVHQRRQQTEADEESKRLEGLRDRLKF